MMACCDDQVGIDFTGRQRDLISWLANDKFFCTEGFHRPYSTLFSTTNWRWQILDHSQTNGKAAAANIVNRNLDFISGILISKSRELITPRLTAGFSFAGLITPSIERYCDGLPFTFGLWACVYLNRRPLLSTARQLALGDDHPQMALHPWQG
jgi:hypothetical protein